MKRRDGLRSTEQLVTREHHLQQRFLAPVWNIAAWDPASLDAAGAYVALLHAEAEFTIETLVRNTVTYSRISSERWKPHPLLVNCMMYFQGELARRMMGIITCPPRADLEADAQKLVDAWENLGARQYFENTVLRNHGVGREYLENLLHPLGVVVTNQTFRRVEGHGVARIAQLPGGVTTELTEFVVLRGLAVHANASSFLAGVGGETPQQIAQRGEATVAFVQTLGKVLVRHAW